MLSTFGIESTRNFIALNFNNLIESTNSSINSRYIYLIADFTIYTDFIAGGGAIIICQAFEAHGFEIFNENITSVNSKFE